MEVRNGLDEFYIKEGSAVTIGKFDGVHKGHQKLINDVVSRAKVSGIKSCVITFDSKVEIPCASPVKEPQDDYGESKEPEETGVSDNDEGVEASEEKLEADTEESLKPSLTSFEEKKAVLEELGVDILVVFKPDESFKRMNPYAFIDSVLIDKLNMQSVSIGPDFRFGHKRDGKAMTFVKAAMIYGYGVNVLDKEESDGKPVSSTDIRERLSAGDIEAVNVMLGRKYSVSGITRSGQQIGRTIGFPTMNLYPDEDKLLPPNGVYETEVKIGGKLYKAVTNVGVRPTVSKDSDTISVESHLLDFKDFGGSDYDKEITVYFVSKLRDEKKFDSREELAEQISKDIEMVKQGNPVT